MVAITTKFHGATNTKGSRVSASANGHRVYVSYPHELSGAEVHFQAVKKPCDKLDWHGDLISGGTETGYVFCFAKSGKFTV